MVLNCEDLRLAGITKEPCCHSCHEDHEDFGYDLCDGGDYAEVCCIVADSFNKEDPRVKFLWESKN